MKIIIAFVISLLAAAGVRAGMVRVVDVQDGRTLVIERNGGRETIRLAGLEVVDEFRAKELLRWTAGTSWILVEAGADGTHFVWRSPDALFLNRELVLRGYARATQYGIEPESNLRVTYLGEVNPDVVPNRPAISAPPRTGTGTRRRSSGSPSRRTAAARAGGRPETPAAATSQKP